jgi:hypothetical protein
MKEIEYSYSVVKYVHDPVAGESLNIGVIVCAPAALFCAVRLEHRYERLSETFVNFDGEHFKRTLRQLETAIHSLQQQSQTALFPLFDPLNDVEAVRLRLWPDSDLSFQFGPMLVGLTDDPMAALERLYHRMVLSQQQRKVAERRSDEEVWSTYQASLMAKRLHRALQPKSFTAAGFELKYEHSFKNERWHILQPVSLDYARAEGMRNKVSRLLGDATVLQGNPELGKLYLLLGKPRQREHFADYDKARLLLERMPVEHTVVEEQEAKHFAEQLADYMHKHGVLSDV